MNILHVVNNLDPALGGPPSVAVKLSAAQARLGHDVSLIGTLYPDRRADVERVIAQTPGSEALRVYPQALGGRFERIWMRNLMGELCRITTGVNVLHLHGVWDPILLRAASQARRMGRPYVVRPCGMLDPWSLSQHAWKKWIAMAMFYRRMLDRAAVLHCLNVDERRLIEVLDLRAPKVVVPNGMNLEEIDPPPMPGEFRRKYSELGDRPYLLFLSRLHFKKGLDILATAYAQFIRRGGDMSLVVAGPDDGDGSKQDFERRIQAADLSQHVLMTGPIYGDAKYEAICDAAAFVLPSRQEGFSVAITEAMACGRPVVITKNCHFPEVAQAGAGIVTGFDADEVAAALWRIAQDPEASAAMGRAGAALVRQQYTWAKIAARTLEVYHEFGNVNKC